MWGANRVPIGNLMISIGVHRFVLIRIELYECVLIYIDLYWLILVGVDFCLIFIDVYLWCGFVCIYIDLYWLICILCWFTLISIGIYWIIFNSIEFHWNYIELYWFTSMILNLHWFIVPMWIHMGSYGQGLHGPTDLHWPAPIWSKILSHIREMVPGKIHLTCKPSRIRFHVFPGGASPPLPDP